MAVSLTIFTVSESEHAACLGRLGAFLDAPCVLLPLPGVPPPLALLVGEQVLSDEADARRRAEDDHVQHRRRLLLIGTRAGGASAQPLGAASQLSLLCLTRNSYGI